MAFTEIIDGEGSSKRVGVTKYNRLKTESVTKEAIEESASIEEETYILSSGFITITTTASFSGIFYIKGLDSDSRFKIKRIRVSTSTDTPDCHVQVKLTANATTGTLISDANVAYSHNTVLSSSNSLSGLYTLYSASGDGKTITNGNWFTQFQQHSPGHSEKEYSGAVIIDKNTSLAISVKPCAETEVCVEVLGHKETIN